MNTPQRFVISDISIPPGGRDLHDDRITDLAGSMDKLGLLNPIGVRMVEGKPVLVYGRYRHAAAQRLGWTEIDCHILDVDDDRHARMAEIAENLHRAELSVLERSNQTDEWIKLVEEGNSAQVAQKSGPGRPEGGISAASRELGIDRDAARRAQIIANLPYEAKATAVDVGLDDNQSALLKAAKSSDPAATLQAQAEETAQKREERKQRKQDRNRWKEEEARLKAERDAAVQAVAELLTDRLRPHKMREFVENMDRINFTFLDESTLMTAMCKRRPELFAWLDEDNEHDDTDGDGDTSEEASSDLSNESAVTPNVATDAQTCSAESEQMAAA